MKSAAVKGAVRVVLAGLTSLAAFGGARISSDMPASTPSGTVDIIVQFKTKPTAEALNQVLAAGEIKRQYRAIPAVHMTVPVSMIGRIASNPLVVYVSPDRTTTGSLDITTQTVNANQFWSSGFDGTGIGVAVIDSGVTSKLDLWTADHSRSRVVFSESFVPGLDSSDDYGHGTHVAGIVAANGAASTGPGFTRTLKGLAPNANIINLRVLDAQGNGRESEVIAAIDEAIALKQTYNIRIINLSLGHPIYESFMLDPLCQAAEAAWKAGITVVVAAGNMGRSGYATINSPGNDPFVITVGAMNANYTPWRGDDKIASYSSKGPTAGDHIVKPDLVAPGNGIVSLLASRECTLATEYPDTLVSNSYYQAGSSLGPVMGTSADYFKLSGTSMAVPVVSGTVALMLQQNPALTPDQVKARLMKTASKGLPRFTTATDVLSSTTYSTQEDIFAVGAGYLDVQAAMWNTDIANFQALSPVAVYNSSTKTVSLVSAQSVMWGDSTMSGFSAIWSNNALTAGGLQPAALNNGDK